MLAVVILDSADPSVLRDLISAGALPTLGRLSEEGTVLGLQSEAHQMDGSVFQTLVTGVDPSKHGIYKYHSLIPGTYRYRKTKAADSPVPQIWASLSERGYRCCVFDVPKCFPIDGFRGKMVASWGSYTPAASPGSVPEELYHEIERRYGKHPLRFQKPLPRPAAEYSELADELVRAAQTRTEICQSLLEKESYDFFMVAFSESHIGCHQFWHLRDKEHPMYDAEAATLAGDAMERIYEAIDQGIAGIAQALPPETTLVVLTQQGVANNYTGSHLMQDWLALREGAPRGRAKTSWLVKARAALGSPLRVWIFQHFPDFIVNRLAELRFRPSSDVYMLPGSEFSTMLRVNLEGREPAGTVAPKDYEKVLKELETDLKALVNPATGKAAVDEVILTHEHYSGPLLESLPDAVVSWVAEKPIESLECPRFGLVTEAQEFADMTHSKHTKHGMALFSGPGISAAELPESRDIRDLHATLYALLDEDPPQWLDGRPIVLNQERKESRA